MFMRPIDRDRPVVGPFAAWRYFQLVGAQTLLLMQPHDAEKEQAPGGINGRFYLNLERVPWDCYALGVYKFRHANKMAHMIAARLEP